jgi:hypothetical protein
MEWELQRHVQRMATMATTGIAPRRYDDFF